MILKFVKYICIHSHNEDIGRYRCKKCQDQADICAIDSSKTSLYFQQQLFTAGIKIQPIPEPRLYEEYME